VGGVAARCEDRGASLEAVGDAAWVIHLAREPEALAVVRERVGRGGRLCEVGEAVERGGEIRLVRTPSALDDALLERPSRLLRLSGGFLRDSEVVKRNRELMA
jgi:hypothetical protein